MFDISIACGLAGSNEDGSFPHEASSEPAYVAYRWVSVCAGIDSTNAAGTFVECGAARACPDQTERLWRLWGKRLDGTWDPLGSQCFGRPPTAADTPQPQVTPGLVLQALRRVGLPALAARTQPAGKTLVNFATIFYADPQPVSRGLRLLGHDVQVEATPTSYLWHYGDGTSARTESPGAPYPAMDITYKYIDAHVTVHPSVDVTYTARFRVDGGGWQSIPDTVTIVGPVGDLRIAEATPLLSGDYS